MADLYGRYWRVTVGRPLGTGASDLQEVIAFEGFRTAFEVERSHKPEPNTGVVKLYNLAAATRAKLQDKGLSMTLEAGYQSASSIILRADVERVTLQREGADWVTILEADDGSRSLGQARTRISFDAGAKLTDVMRTLAKNMGVGFEKAIDQAKQGNFSRSLSEFANGVVVSGKTNEAFDRVMRAAGMEWSVQNNELVVTAKGQPTTDQAVVISTDTGMIGSPEPLKDDKDAGRDALRLQSLIVPGLDPPRKVEVRSRAYNGFARVERVKYTGDSGADDWYAELEVVLL